MKVTSGLPHYSNSKAARDNFEPLFLNQFEVIITPPAVIPGGVILTEHVKKVTGLPEITPTGKVEQFYKFAKRTYADARPEDTTAELTIDFEVNLDENNSMYVYNTLRAWADLQYDPMTGGQGLKRDYAGALSVLIHNKAQDLYREFRFSPVYLIAPFNAMEPDYRSNEIYIFTAKFQADAWVEVRNVSTGTEK